MRPCGVALSFVGVVALATGNAGAALARLSSPAFQEDWRRRLKDDDDLWTQEEVNAMLQA